jgi:hypothetical protein
MTNKDSTQPMMIHRPQSDFFETEKAAELFLEKVNTPSMNLLAKHEVEYIHDRPSQESGLAKDNGVLKSFKDGSRTVEQKNSVEQVLAADGDMVVCSRQVIVVKSWNAPKGCLFDDKGDYRHEAQVEKVEPNYKQAI